jgi:hypothetical protein
MYFALSAIDKAALLSSTSLEVASLDVFSPFEADTLGTFFAAEAHAGTGDFLRLEVFFPARAFVDFVMVYNAVWPLSLSLSLFEYIDVYNFFPNFKYYCRFWECVYFVKDI